MKLLSWATATPELRKRYTSPSLSASLRIFNDVEAKSFDEDNGDASQVKDDG